MATEIKLPRLLDEAVIQPIGNKKLQIAMEIVEMDNLFLFLMSVSNGSVLAVVADATCDVGLIGYEMAMLVSRTEATLTPQLITEMRGSLPVDGATRAPSV